MTDLALVTDHATEALGLLIDQYQGLPRLSGLVSSFVNRVQELEGISWDTANKRLLDYTALDGSGAHAVAAQLDAIGRLVGQGRQGQSDAVYLTYVRARVFLNKSRARRSNVTGVLQLIESAAFAYEEFYPGTVLVTYLTAPSSSPAVLFGIAKLAVTGGVRFYLVAPPPSASASGTFAFSNYGTSSDTARAFGSTGSALYGGVASSEYA